MMVRIYTQAKQGLREVIIRTATVEDCIWSLYSYPAATTLPKSQLTVGQQVVE